MALEKVTQTVEGIFDVETKTGGYAHEQKKTAEGTLTSIQEAEFKYRSTAISTDESKKMLGVRLEIQNQRGRETVELPREISLTDRQAMLNQNVRYSQNIWSSTTEGTSTDYALEILSGPLSGQKITRRVFV